MSHVRDINFNSADGGNDKLRRGYGGDHEANNRGVLLRYAMKLNGI